MFAGEETDSRKEFYQNMEWPRGKKFFNTIKLIAELS